MPDSAGGCATELRKGVAGGGTTARQPGEPHPRAARPLPGAIARNPAGKGRSGTFLRREPCAKATRKREEGCGPLGHQGGKGRVPWQGKREQGGRRHWNTTAGALAGKPNGPGLARRSRGSGLVLVGSRWKRAVKGNELPCPAEARPPTRKSPLPSPDNEPSLSLHDREYHRASSRSLPPAPPCPRSNDRKQTSLPVPQPSTTTPNGPPFMVK